VRQSPVGGEWFHVQSLGREQEERIEEARFEARFADMLLINIQTASAFNNDQDVKVSTIPLSFIA